MDLNESEPNVCSVLDIGNVYHIERFELEYGSECGGVNCNPPAGNLGYVPKFMLYYNLRCTEGNKLQMLLGLSIISHYSNRFCGVGLVCSNG